MPTPEDKESRSVTELVPQVTQRVVGYSWSVERSLFFSRGKADDRREVSYKWSAHGNTETFKEMSIELMHADAEINGHVSIAEAKEKPKAEGSA